MAPREAGGSQNKLRHRLAPGPGSGSSGRHGHHWGAQAPDTTLLLHPRFLIPPQFHLPRPSTRSISLMSQTLYPQVWFLTYPDTYRLCGNVRNYSHLEASTWESGVASLNGSGPAGNCCSSICHTTAVYRAPTNCGVRPALHTTYQHSPTSWSQANNGT